MSKARANGLELEYETFGRPNNSPLVLVMGLGAQMIAWPEALCEGLADKGFYVIRFDNRDSGRSTWLNHLGIPDVAAMYSAAEAGEAVDSPYSLADMAADTIALLDALDLPDAHIAGGSMGGMIAQICAAGYPDRVRSMTSIMSTSGRRQLPPGEPEAMSAIVTPPDNPEDRESIIETDVRALQIISGTGYPLSREYARDLAARSYERGYNLAGTARQFAAILADGSRARLLQRIQRPSLVVHGDHDPLIPPAAGEDTAALIPGAELRMIRGMGHHIAAEIIPELIDHLTRHCTDNGQV